MTIDIDALNVQAEKEAYSSYNWYVKNLCRFDPEALTLLENPPKTLDAVEKAFLKYIDGSLVSTFSPAQYWYYDYGLNYKEEIRKFLSMRLVKISSTGGLDKRTVSELKEILISHNLPVSGKKADLISCIASNLSTEEVQALFPPGKTYYKLTQDGKELVSTVKKSVTKNIELEDACLRFIQEGDYNSPYLKVANYRSDAPGDSGLGIDWKEESSSGISKDRENFYKGFVGSSQGLLRAYRQAIVLCDMLGAANKVRALLSRLYSEIDTETLETAEYTFSVAQNLQDLSEYKKDGIVKYEILSAMDSSTCPACRKKGEKTYLVSQAQIGVNFPPLCKHCRCTTVPHTSRK